MTNPTSNFGWQMPTPVDLVTDLPADFEVFGQAVDTAMADLKGGTTGQILSKTTNTDMDFTWITNDVGDITAVNTTAPLAGGATSGAVTLSVTTATTSATGVVQLSDSTTTTSSVLAATPTAVKAAYDPAFTNNFYAGKNKLINGNFNIFQRGTSTSVPASVSTFVSDRWQSFQNGTGSCTVSRETFTPGQTDVPNNPTYYIRTTGGTGTSYISDLVQFIENVNTFANQTVMISFYAKASSTQNVSLIVTQNFGSGGSAAVDTTVTLSASTLTASWVRYTGTATLPSITGKTVGASNYLGVRIRNSSTSNGTTWDLSNVQVEAGSVATPFQTATGSIEGELAACQRYYYRVTAGSPYGYVGYGNTYTTTDARVSLMNPVNMRVKATAIEAANVTLQDGVGGSFAVTATISGAITNAQTNFIELTGTGFTAFRPMALAGNNNSAGYIALSAEL